MRIALVCFGIGTIANVAGTEKVFVQMANALAQRGHEVVSIWNDEPTVAPFYPFTEQVKTINLGLGKIKVPVGLKILREVNKGLHLGFPNAVDEYKYKRLGMALEEVLDWQSIDVFICYEFNSYMVINRVTKGEKPVVVMVHNSVENLLEPLTTLQRKEASRATMYQVLLPSFVEEAKKIVNTDVCYIPNVVEQVPDYDTAILNKEKKRYIIVFLGRIEPNRKRPFIAIKAFAKIAKKFSDWEFHYYGPIMDKAYKKDIDNFICAKRLEKQIIYKGITKDPGSVFKQSDILAFPSESEGFPLVLTEAAAVGIPCIGFADAAGVNELIQDGKSGYLVCNEQEFCEKMQILIENQLLREQMGKQARENMKQYAPDIVWKTWETLLVSLVKRFHER